MNLYRTLITAWIFDRDSNHTLKIIYTAVEETKLMLVFPSRI